MTQNSSVGDGYYQLSIDQDGDGLFEATRSFFRLFGDVNGDRVVDNLDINLVRNATGQSGSSLNEDVNGDGLVNRTDLNYVRNMKGHKLATGLVLDD